MAENKLSEEQRSELKINLRTKIDDAVTFIQQKFEPKDIERDQRYNADPALYRKKWPDQLNESELVDTSVWNTTERIVASLMKVFFGTDEIGTIKGRTADDDSNAENMQELINWQIEYKNQGFLRFGQWFKDGLVKCVAAVQITWKRETGDKEKSESVPSIYLQEVTQQVEAQKELTIASVEPDVNMPGNMIVTVQYEDVVTNEPLIENVPMSELFWSPEARNFKEAELVGRRKKVTIDHLRRNIKRKAKDGSIIGMYDKKAVEELALGGDAGTDTPLDIQIKDNYATSNNSATQSNDPNREVEIFECYIKYDINDDGLLEDVIATICGDVLLRCEANEDGLPFCLISPVYDPHKVVPTRCSMDNIGQWQDFLTALYRLILQNIDYNNNPQIAIVPSKFRDVNQIIDRAQYLELQDGVQTINEALQPVAQIPLAPYTLNLVEMIKGFIEEGGAVSRINQGIQPKAATKTLGGMELLANMGSQSLELIARNYAETGVKDAIMRMVFLNQKYIDQPQVVRLVNKDIQVNKDNLSGEFDYIVNAGMGAGAKETDIQNMQMLLAMYPQAIGAGIATQDNAYNAFKKLILSMGIKNVDDFCADPKVIAQQQAGQPKSSAKLTESLQVKFAELPINVKVQILQAQGIQATPQDFIDDLILQSQVKQREAIHGQIARANIQGPTGAGMPGIPPGNIPANPAGDMAGGGQGQGPGNVNPGGSPMY